nr:GDT1-like protein 4 [Tanacetum cinerariifolium]
MESEIGNTKFVDVCTSWILSRFEADDDTKKKSRPFLSQFFTPIFLKAFSITFFGEWGVKSQMTGMGCQLKS